MSQEQQIYSGGEIREWREKENVTRARLADLSGIPVTRIAALELGKLHPSKSLSARIESVLIKISHTRNAKKRIPAVMMFHHHYCPHYRCTLTIDCCLGHKSKIGTREDKRISCRDCTVINEEVARYKRGKLRIVTAQGLAKGGLIDKAVYQ